MYSSLRQVLGRALVLVFGALLGLSPLLAQDQSHKDEPKTEPRGKMLNQSPPQALVQPPSGQRAKPVEAKILSSPDRAPQPPTLRTLPRVFNYYDLPREVPLSWDMLQAKPDRGDCIIVSKQAMRLAVVEAGRVKWVFPMACGRRFGNKRGVGDLRTPEGDFSIERIQEAADWTHDFGDGLGEVEGAYGSHFIRLLTPGHRGIGIHGTHDSRSLGKRASEGCIRLHNRQLLDLVRWLKEQERYKHTSVLILPDRPKARLEVKAFSPKPKQASISGIISKPL